MISVDQEADECVEKNDEDCAQRRSKEIDFSLSRMTLGHEATSPSDKVKEEKGCESHGSVNLSSRQMFERADDDFICSSSGIEATETEHRWYLARGNAKSRSSHKRRNGREWNEVNDPAASDQTNESDDTSSNNTDGRSNNLWCNLRMLHPCLVDDMANQGRNNGNGL